MDKNSRILNDTQEIKNLINMSIYCGKLLIKNGAEIYRAEDTIQRICSSIDNVSSVDAYILPSWIFVSIEVNGETITKFKKVNKSNINLAKIDLLNSFSRRFINENLSYEQSMRILKNIDNFNNKDILSLCLFAGCAGSFFTVLFGGNFNDFIASFIVTFITSFVLEKIANVNFSFVIDNFIGAFVTSLGAILLSKFVIGDNIDMIIIGAIMILVPGVPTTNAIRDIMNADLLSGLVGLTKAIFIALSIALGVGIALKIFM